MPCIGLRKRVAIAWKDEMQTIIVAAGVIIDNGKVLVSQRKKDAPRGGLWEFPGGKVMEGEEPRQALKRELKEELGVEAEIGLILEAVFHTYPEYPILLLAYHCRIEKGTPEPLGCHDLQWIDIKGLERLSMPPADGPILKRLIPFFSGQDSTIFRS